MDSLAVKEKQKYERLWRSFPQYREVSPADVIIPIFLSYFKAEIKKGDSLIDFGCGTGKVALPLLQAGMSVKLLDFCDNCLDPEIFLQTLDPKSRLSFVEACLWDLPINLSSAEWILCFDVLEHLPEEMVDGSLKGMASRMQKGGAFKIFLKEDLFGHVCGESLHLTLKPAAWWREKISSHFSISQEVVTETNYLAFLR